MTKRKKQIIIGWELTLIGIDTKANSEPFNSVTLAVLFFSSVKWRWENRDLLGLAWKSNLQNVLGVGTMPIENECSKLSSYRHHLHHDHRCHHQWLEKKYFVQHLFPLLMGQSQGTNPYWEEAFMHESPWGAWRRMLRKAASIEQRFKFHTTFSQSCWLDPCQGIWI